MEAPVRGQVTSHSFGKHRYGPARGNLRHALAFVSPEAIGEGRFMPVSRWLVTVFICAMSAFTSSATTFPRENGFQIKSAGAAGQQPSAGAGTIPVTNSTLADGVRSSALQLKVKWERGKLSLDAEAVPLSEALLEVSRATGIEFLGADGLSNLVSIHLARAELSQALHDLLLNVDYAVTAGSQGLASPQGTRVIIVGRSSLSSPSAASRAEGEPNISAAQPAIQAVDSTPANDGAQTIKLGSIQAMEGADREAVTQAQRQDANQTVQTDQQSLVAAAPPESSDPGPSAEIGANQPPTQNGGSVELQPSSEDLAGTAPLNDSQTENLAAIESAAATQDREALGTYMQHDNVAVQAAAFDALAANDNTAAVENLLAEIEDPSQPVRLQALQLLGQSPQVSEEIVMTTLIDALNGADPSFSASAAHALAERGTPEAMNALSELLNSSDPSTRLMLLQSVAQTQAGLAILRAALSDSNETVRSTAEALLQQSEAMKNP
jgi:Spy/CpxP family protein refolding chaperone